MPDIVFSNSGTGRRYVHSAAVEDGALAYSDEERDGERTVTGDREARERVMDDFAEDEFFAGKVEEIRERERREKAKPFIIALIVVLVLVILATVFFVLQRRK